MYVFTVIPPPWFSPNRENAQLKAFVQGRDGGRHRRVQRRGRRPRLRAVYDAPTALSALVSLEILWRYKVPEPILVVAAAVVGLVMWPLMNDA